MFVIKKEAFGDNFEITKKLVPDDFAATIFKSLSATIEETKKTKLEEKSKT